MPTGLYLEVYIESRETQMGGMSVIYKKTPIAEIYADDENRHLLKKLGKAYAKLYEPSLSSNHPFSFYLMHLEVKLKKMEKIPPMSNQSKRDLEEEISWVRTAEKSFKRFPGIFSKIWGVSLAFKELQTLRGVEKSLLQEARQKLSPGEKKILVNFRRMAKEMPHLAWNKIMGDGNYYSERSEALERLCSIFSEYEKTDQIIRSDGFSWSDIISKRKEAKENQLKEEAVGVKAIATSKSFKDLLRKKESLVYVNWTEKTIKAFEEKAQKLAGKDKRPDSRALFNIMKESNGVMRDILKEVALRAIREETRIEVLGEWAHGIFDTYDASFLADTVEKCLVAAAKERLSKLK